jgi:hypothetical protein
MREPSVPGPGSAVDRLRAAVRGHRVRRPGRVPVSGARRVLIVAALLVTGVLIAVVIALSGLLSSDAPPPSCRPKPGPDRAEPEDLPYRFPIEPCTWAG